MHWNCWFDAFFLRFFDWLIDCFLDCLMDRLIDWLMDCLMGGLIDWLIDFNSVHTVHRTLFLPYAIQQIGQIDSAYAAIKFYHIGCVFFGFQSMEIRHSARGTSSPPTSPAVWIRINPTVCNSTLFTDQFRCYATGVPKNDPGHEKKFRNRTTLNYMTALVILVLGLSYAAVPMYRMFCQVPFSCSSRRILDCSWEKRPVFYLRKLTFAHFRSPESAVRQTWHSTATRRWRACRRQRSENWGYSLPPTPAPVSSGISSPFNEKSWYGMHKLGFGVKI